MLKQYMLSVLFWGVMLLSTDGEALDAKKSLLSNVVQDDASVLNNSEMFQTIVWPEFVPDSTKEECFQNPRLPAMLSEIDRLRQARASESRQAYSRIQKDMDSYLKALHSDGEFADLVAAEVIADLKRRGVPSAEERYMESLMEFASNRLSSLARMWAFGPYQRSPEIKQKLYLSTKHYLTREMNRPRTRWSWCASAMVTPAAATEVYLLCLEDMEAVERGELKDPLTVEVNRLCRLVAPRCFSEQPRQDAPNPLSIERFRHSGAWTGGNFGYRPLLDAALVCRNPKMVEIVVEVCFGALSVTSWNTRKNSFWQEGMTADGSGWGHGVQGYVWGYPMDGIKAVLRQLKILRGSMFLSELDLSKLMLVADYAEGTMWYYYRPDGYTLMAPGRIAMEYGPFHRSKHAKSLAKNLLELLPENNTEAERVRLQRIIDIGDGKLPEVAGNRYFWNNDDLIQRRSDYYIGINMSCHRSASTEVVFTRSSHTEFFGAGVTFIMKRPDAFNVAKGFLDYSAMPGTTVRKCDQPANYENWSGFRGLHNFAGGISDGVIGACAFRYEIAPHKSLEHLDIYGTRAQKAYFLFDDAMVCLGAGIEDDKNNNDVRTCLNQAEYCGSVEFSSDGGKTVLELQAPYQGSFKQEIMLTHEGVGYLTFPGQTPVEITLEERPSRWLEIYANANRQRTDKPEKLTMLQLLFNHGPQPQQSENDTYAYAILPRCPDVANLKKICEQQHLELLSNTRFLQAVRHRKSHVVQAVFYQPGTLEFGQQQWTVSAPAVLMLKEADNKVDIIASDPEQNPDLSELLLTVNRKLSGDGVISSTNGVTQLRLVLPPTPYCGKAVRSVFAVE